MNFDDTAKFGSGPSTISEHICPQCVLNGRSHWTANKIFCDHCIVVRESFGVSAFGASKPPRTSTRRNARPPAAAD